MRIVIVLLATLACSACYRASVIGPFVKRVTRSADVLTIESCQIALYGEQLYEQSCIVEYLSLHPAPGSVPPPAAPPRVEGPSPVASPAPAPGPRSP